MNCTNCGQPSAADYCPNCEQFRDRLERLRVAQQERRRNPGPYRKPPKRVGAGFMDQCRRAEQLAKAGELPLSGQDAALPVGDR